MEQIRLLAQNLRPPALDTIGLNPTLDGLCRTFAQHADLPVSYYGADLPQLPETIKISLYRVLQEALTNVVRHACASHVVVTLQADSATISLTVVDDGQGFQPAGWLYSGGRPVAAHVLRRAVAAAQQGGGG